MARTPPGGKGCIQRPFDTKKFDSEFERIFGKKEKGNARKEGEVPADDDSKVDDRKPIQHFI